MESEHSTVPHRDCKGLCRVGSWGGRSNRSGFAFESPQRSAGLEMGRGYICREKSRKLGMLIMPHL